MKTKHTILTILTFVTCSLAFAQNYVADFNVVPRVGSIAASGSGNFELRNATPVVVEAGVSRHIAQYLIDNVRANTGISLRLAERAKDKQPAIVLATGLKHDSPEAYRITSDSKGMKLVGSTNAGLFYAVQTLLKSLPVVPNRDARRISFPNTALSDSPRFGYRGVHLDVSRHFLPVDSVKAFIDLLAYHNINRMHWHLTDDQGWRVEIKKYPRLTSVGSYRPETVIGHNSGKYDGTPHGGFYTQDELRDVVAYAADRFVTIVPEIDMPGHMLGALAAYPELGCTGGPYEVWKIWGVSEDVLCAGNDKVLDFIDDVLDEVVQIFPSQYIHVGGDECPKTAWKKCPKCQARIKAENLEADGKHTAEERLQSYIIRHAEAHLRSLGRDMIGWDEVLEGGLAPGATVMSWRGEVGGIEAARQGHDVIMTPNTYLYFDYYQSRDIAKEPESIGGFLPLERVYGYEPLPAELTAEEARHIVGVQANIWTEYIPTFRQLQYMALPRMAALAEVQWASPEKEYGDFCRRTARLIEHYRDKGLNYARHIYDPLVTCTSDNAEHCIRLKVETFDNADIRYTLDGTEPTISSAKYTDEMALRESCSVRVAAFRGDEISNAITQHIVFSKCTATDIRVNSEIDAQYRFAGGRTLVDGLTGETTNFQTGRWIAFREQDLDCTIDFGQPETFSSVGIGTLVDTGNWIFDLRSLSVEASDDGINFEPIASESYPAMTCHQPGYIESHELHFAPHKARFLRLKGETEHAMPQWHDGRGQKAYLFVDEISVK